MDHEGRHIPNRLRQYRKFHRYTQKEVSQLLGLSSASRLSRWEQGVSTPSLKNLLQLSSIYRTVVNELYIELYRDLQDELETRKQNGKPPKS